VTKGRSEKGEGVRLRKKIGGGGGEGDMGAGGEKANDHQGRCKYQVKKLFLAKKD